MSKVRVAVVGVGHLGKDSRPPAGATAAGGTGRRRRSAARSLGTQVAADLAHDRLRRSSRTARQDRCRDRRHAHAQPLCRGHAICSPHGVHVLVEKPITLNVADADDLVATAEPNRLVLQVGHVERFNPALTAAAPQIREPKYIEAVRATGYSCRSTDIGVVLDLMIHDIDMVLSLVRDDVVDVQSLGAAVFGPNEDWAKLDSTSHTAVSANLTATRVSDQPQRLAACRLGRRIRSDRFRREVRQSHPHPATPFAMAKWM